MSELPRGIVVDSSVLVADARPSEASHSESKTLLRALYDLGATIHLPAIVLAEIAAALTRAVGDPWLGQRAAEVFRHRRGVRIASVDVLLGERAARLAAEQRLRGCDAVYIALAQTLGAPLVTLDREQRERTPPSVSALTPSEALERFRF